MIRAGAFVLLAAPTIWLVARAGETDPDYRIDQVRANVHVIRGAGANTVVVAGSDGLTVVDSKFARHGAALRRAIQELDAGSIGYLINTHDHLENTEGNAAIADAGSRILAHDAADRRLRQRDGTGAAIRYRSRLTIEFGDETITLHHKGPGHTDGDTIVHFAKARILAVGGLIARGVHPAYVTEDGADLRKWIRTLEDLGRDFDDDDDLVVVPGDGEPGGRDLIDTQAEYLRDVLDFMEQAQRHGLTRDEALREAGALRAKYATYRGDHFEQLLGAAYAIAGR